MIPLMVVLGAMVGAPTRYLIDRLLTARRPSVFPWGTLTVNVIGSLILGALAGLAPSDRLTHLIGTGFCGALTTFSTFGYGTVDVFARGRRRVAVGYVLTSLALGLAAAALGYAAGRAA
ncbi:fluoride efflux transporter CrcB [Embleya sp. NBC_00896]|uniref:fluoride efflux transporter CrcB n=1 Tax=Embleya sp. NBC_00896 TaxID=2975961 RepID=UPI003870C8B4|nr:fluoride efflux transporter CrcB [Embleya sp. NBC_00896]